MNCVAKNFEELSVYELYEIMKARAEIFLLEQNIVCQDLDDVDKTARHFFLEDNGKIYAYLRAYYVNTEKTCVKIGRVLSLTHGKGHGRVLMEFALRDIIENMGCKEICVSSQKQAEGFYAKMGFVTFSDEYLEEGITHVKMYLRK